MCRWKQHFSVNLEALSSAAFGVRKNPQGPKNKWLHLQAASKITSLSASLFSWVTLHSYVDRILKSTVREDRKRAHSPLHVVACIYFPFSVSHCLYEWHPSEQAHTYLSAGISQDTHRAWGVLPSKLMLWTICLPLSCLSVEKHTDVFKCVAPTTCPFFF